LFALQFNLHFIELTKLAPWPESASELYRLSDRRLSAKLVPTFANLRCHLVSVKDPYGRILGFLDWSRYFFQAAPQFTHEAEWAPLHLIELRSEFNLAQKNVIPLLHIYCLFPVSMLHIIMLRMT
jgi:hypothetical protein